MQDCGHTSEWAGPSVERVMRNGKRIFTSAFKAWLVDQAGKPAVSVAGLALRHGVNANQLRRWMRLRHLQPGSATPTLLPVTIATGPALPPLPPLLPPTAAPEQPSPGIEIEFAGATIRLRGAVDAEQLRRVVAALRA